MSYFSDLFNNPHTAIDLIKITPPVGVTTLTLLGYNINNIAVCLTIIYTSLMIYITIRDKIVSRNRRSTDKKEDE